MPAPLTISGWLRFDLVQRRVAVLDVQSVLEIGPGVGGFASRLAREYAYVGVELDPQTAAIAAARLAAVGAGEVIAGGPDAVGPRCFDLVCAFEVLEHIEDDSAALLEWCERVRPGGWLMLSVPAGRRRWGAHDEAAGHFRRYERGQLTALLQGARLEEIEFLNYGFPLLTALRPLWARLSSRAQLGPTLEARTRASGRFRQPSRWLGWATAAVAAPFRIVQRPFVRSDLGTGYVAVARRPQTVT